MQISNTYIAVTKFVEPEKEGFKTVELQDSSLFKGVVHAIPEAPIYLGNLRVGIGDVVLFAKYSPDTHEVEEGGVKMKFINTKDLLAKL